MLFYGVLPPFLQIPLRTPGPEESFISSCFHSTLSLLSTLKLYTIPLEFANPAQYNYFKVPTQLPTPELFQTMQCNQLSTVDS